jgi:hypothetical protein
MDDAVEKYHTNYLAQVFTKCLMFRLWAFPTTMKTPVDVKGGDDVSFEERLRTVLACLTKRIRMCKAVLAACSMRSEALLGKAITGEWEEKTS